MPSLFPLVLVFAAAQVGVVEIDDPDFWSGAFAGPRPGTPKEAAQPIVATRLKSSRTRMTTQTPLARSCVPFAASRAPRERPEPPSRSSAAERWRVSGDAVLVYGAGASDDEGAELLARARFEQSSQGRRRFPVVFLYGNADANRAWSRAVPADLPIRVRRGSARVCGREFVGEDLVVLFAHRGARWGLEVRGVAPTGPRGARLDLLRALVGLEPSEPDWIVLGPSNEAPGVRVVASGTWDGR